MADTTPSQPPAAQAMAGVTPPAGPSAEASTQRGGGARADASAPLPYKMACLCDLRDEHGRVLLLERRKAPNHGLWSPIGGKLEMATGESPAQCARREIHEEAGLELPIDRLRLMGLISERAFEGRGHWLLFYFRVLGAVPAGAVRTGDIGEGHLEWVEQSRIAGLALPRTDREVIWPLVNRHAASGPAGSPGFFSVHIDCHGPQGEDITWAVEQQTPA